LRPMEKRLPSNLEVSEDMRDEIIITTIKTTLQTIFGKRVSGTINKALRIYSVRWDEIPSNPILLSEILTKMLGSGHVIVEDLILENLYEELGVPYAYIKDYRFHNHLERIRKME